MCFASAADVSPAVTAGEPRPRRAPALQAIVRRLDSMAIDQLRAECSRLAVENEQLRDELYWSEKSAESWQEDAERFQEELCAKTGGEPGLTVNGALVVVAAVSQAAQL